MILNLVVQAPIFKYFQHFIVSFVLLNLVKQMGQFQINNLACYLIIFDGLISFNLIKSKHTY